MKDYMTIAEAAAKWGIGNRRITTLCKTGRIPGAEKFGRAWSIPADAEKPADRRIVSGLYVKSGTGERGIDLCSEQDLSV